MVEFAHWWFLRAAWAIDFLVPEAYAMYRPMIMWYIVFGLTLGSYMLLFRLIVAILNFFILIAKQIYVHFSNLRDECRV